MPLANYLIEENLFWEARTAVPIKLQDILRFDIVAVAHIMDTGEGFVHDACVRSIRT